MRRTNKTRVDEHEGGEFPRVDVGLRSRLYRRILGLVGSATEAEDLTQETLLRVYRALPRFRGDASLETWALRIAENVVRDYHRHRASHPTERAKPLVESELTGPRDNVRLSPEEELDGRLSAECVRDTLKALPDDYRKAVELHDFEGLENPEIAKILGLPLSTVKVRVHRGRRRLQSACRDNCEPYRDERGNVSCQPKKSKRG